MVKKAINQRPRAIDLFAGAGGLSIGLESAGFDLLYANEISSVYSETLRSNHPSALISVDDIRSVDPELIRRDLKLAPGDLELLAGGPPCQGFSINAPSRSTDDHRNHLFLNFLHFVKVFLPKVVLIENVPGMVSFNDGETVRAILESLKELGYNAAVRILGAPHYGIPQMRWRTVFLATRLSIDPLALYPPPTHRSQARANFGTQINGESLVLAIDKAPKGSLKPGVTVWDAISDLPPIPNGGGSCEARHDKKPDSQLQKTLRGRITELWNHECAGLGPANLVRLPFIPPGGSWRDIPHDLLPAGMKRARRSDHTKRYGRLDPDGVASTILTKCDPHWGTFIHPNQDRVISVREAARLQAFPDYVRFFGTLIDQYKQVGNAVPPLLGQAIGERIIWCMRSMQAGHAPTPDITVTGSQLAFRL